MQRPRRVVSGGQTGVDRAALDVAIAAGIPHGGWCPRGRRAEDGVIPARYALTETPSADYAERTERNVVESDGTLIFTHGTLRRGGTALTHELAIRHRKPLLCVDLLESPDPRIAQRWIEEHGIDVLNVAGPRESQRSGIGEKARSYLARLLA